MTHTVTCSCISCGAVLVLKCYARAGVDSDRPAAKAECQKQHLLCFGAQTTRRADLLRGCQRCTLPPQRLCRLLSSTLRPLGMLG